LHDPSSNEWYRSFGYNPLLISDSRLAYEAPAFTLEHWMQFCFREVGRRSKKRESIEPESRAWHACSSFAASTLSKNYHYGMLKCFDVPESLMSATAEQLTVMLPLYGAWHGEHVEQCRSKNVTNDDAWSLRDLASGVFRALRDRWDVVQSVYELALYEHNRDIQRGDEFLEALQWNACHPDLHALHLFIETNSTYFETLTGPRDQDPSRFHDPCKKLRRVSLGKRMLYRNALEYANANLGGSTVMMWRQQQTDSPTHHTDSVTQPRTHSSVVDFGTINRPQNRMDRCYAEVNTGSKLHRPEPLRDLFCGYEP
jgi:hypothetical protein